jgi:hypothetical protein
LTREVVVRNGYIARMTSYLQSSSIVSLFIS